jgi:2-polyprenyl-3-methyl-5-hydroxy-6-metoxy-1,4-benzoquinol methylase
MTRRTRTILPDYFDALYAADADPWRFRSSDYEQEKYAETLKALGRRRYRHALEVGCSIGIFTQMLARQCDQVLAIDASRLAVEQARKALAANNNVAFEVRMVPAGFPEGRFDLIVLSEVLYYLEPDDLLRVAAQCADALTPQGEIILCHWLGETDYPLTGTAASELFVQALAKRLPAQAVLRNATYRLDRLSPPS